MEFFEQPVNGSIFFTRVLSKEKRGKKAFELTSPRKKKSLIFILFTKTAEGGLVTNIN